MPDGPRDIEARHLLATTPAAAVAAYRRESTMLEGEWEMRCQLLRMAAARSAS